MLSRAELRAQRRIGQGRSWLMAGALLTGFLGGSAYPVNAYLEMKADQLTREYREAGKTDGPLLKAGDAAHGLLLATEASQHNPILGFMLRRQVKEHRNEWLMSMPEKSRPQVALILDAFIHGADTETLKNLIAKESAFSLAKPSPLSEIDLNGDRAENVKAVKRLMDAKSTNAIDSFLDAGKYHIHYWYIPAKKDMPTILYSNGRNATMLSSANLILQAVEKGYGFIQYEYPQNGESSGELSEDGYYKATDMVYEFLRKDQKVSPDRILNVGYSMGTNLASRLAAKHTDVKNVILISPPEGFAKVYDDVISRHKNTLAAKLAVNSDILDSFNTSKLFMEGKIKGKKILVFYGTKDTYVLPEDTKSLVKKAQADNEVACLPILNEDHSSIRSSKSSLAFMLQAARGYFSLV